MLLSKAVEGFLFSKSADGLSSNILGIYRWALDKLIRFTHDKPVEEITTEDCKHWFVWLRTDYRQESGRKTERLALGSLQNAYTALKSFYTWAQEELGIPRVDKVKRPTGELPVIRVLTEDEIRALLKVAEYYNVRATGNRKAYTQKCPTGIRNVAILMLLLDTGLRAGEASRLRVRDVDQQTGAVTVMPFGSGRKSKPRVVYLGRAARRALWRYLADRSDLEDDAPLFVTDEEKPVRRDLLVQLVRYLGKRAGIKDCHPHVLRHTFATEFIRNGGDVFSLQRALGHSDLAMVRRYVETAQSDVESAFRRASPGDKWRL